MADDVIRVLVADDYAVVREGLRFLIATEPGMHIAGEALDGIDVVFKAGRHSNRYWKRDPQNTNWRCCVWSRRDGPIGKLPIDKIAAAGTLYEYPTGEEWSFILPSTAREIADEIRSFAAPRVPKLELTYGYVELPLIQIHFDTDLSRAEVEARLPGPKVFALPGVETFCSVCVAHPWHDFTIRCDFTFALV